MDRLILALIANAYAEMVDPDEKGKSETRVIMRFHPRVAPIKVCVLPLLKTPLLLVAVVLTLSNLNTVETPLVLTGGGPGDATRILPIEVFERAFVNFDLGSATALAIAMFLGNIILVLAYVRLSGWKA